MEELKPHLKKMLKWCMKHKKFRTKGIKFSMDASPRGYGGNASWQGLVELERLGYLERRGPRMYVIKSL